MDNLAVPPIVLMALKKAKLTTLQNILEYSNNDLVRMTGLKETQVQGLVAIASEAALSHTSSCAAWDLYQREQTQPNWNRLSLGCPLLDQYLHGGLLPKTLVEIAGTSAAGKTQLCLQLALTVQLPWQHGGYKGKAVYISTEGPLPSGRLKQLAEFLISKYPDVNVQQLMNGVFVQHTATVQSLIVMLQHELSSLLKQYNDIKLIIIDSLAALFRVEYSVNEVIPRTDNLKTIITCLHDLLHHYDVIIICTNQMTADVTSNSVRPSLGLYWSNMIQMRLVLLREEGVNNEEEFHADSNPIPRCLRVELAPHLPYMVIHYYIDLDGVHGLDDIEPHFLDIQD